VSESTKPVGLIYAAMTRVALAVGEIKKGRTAEGGNGFGGFKFRGVDDVLNALHKPLAKEGITPLLVVESAQESERSTIKNGATRLSMRVVVKLHIDFTASDGSVMRATSIGEAIDTGDKATSKAISMAVKYAYFNTFCIPTDSPDADEETHELVPTPRQAVAPKPSAKPLPPRFPRAPSARSWPLPLTMRAPPPRRRRRPRPPQRKRLRASRTFCRC
jgi:hypothetical protein